MSENVDQRVKKVFDEFGMKYKIDSDGDFRVIYRLEEERSHLAIIFSNTFEFAGFEMRRIEAIAMKANKIGENAMRYALRQSLKTKVGHWELREANDEEALVFVENVGATLDGKRMNDVIFAICHEADELEKKASDQDRF